MESAQPQVEPMRVRGRRGWLDGYTRRRAADDEEDPPPQRSLLSPDVEPAAPPPADGMLVVVRPPRMRCPACRSERIRKHGCKGPVHYHRCHDCGCHFKSIELGA